MAPPPCVPTHSLRATAPPPLRRRKVQSREQGVRVHTSCGAVRGRCRRRLTRQQQRRRQHKRTAAAVRARAPRARSRALGTRAARRRRAPPHGARAARRGQGVAAPKLCSNGQVGVPRRAAAPSLRPRRGAAPGGVAQHASRRRVGGRRKDARAGCARRRPRCCSARGTPPDLAKKTHTSAGFLRTRAAARAHKRAALPTARSLALPSCLASSKVFLTHGRTHAWAALACQGDAVEATDDVSAALDNCRHVSPRHNLPRHHTVPSST
jgi:hypothetical protein